MSITLKEYRDKVQACFLGKNIGGTLGAPFEGFRGFTEVDYYTHDLSKGVLPNDDLDLQLVWLAAAQRYGRSLTADILADYWLNYIVADWSEYGAAKSNLRAGFPVGQANRINNIHKDSCGCFIRSEVWACLAPGRPDIAVKYAYEDAVIDHADDGMWGEIFFAAIESAAFVEKDIRKLIDIALSYVPADSGLALGVKTAVECYEKKIPFHDAYRKIMQTVPGGFGLNLGRYYGEPDSEVPEGPWGYDAPSNVGIAILSVLYAEGDFSKAVCLATNCCEDGDCTAGSAGALMGIMYGCECIDEKWLLPIGDEIKTVSVDRTKRMPEGTGVPPTVSELTNRIIKLMPTFMQDAFDPETGLIEPAEELKDVKVRKSYNYSRTNCERFALRNRGIKKENSLMEAVIIPVDGETIREGEVKTVEFHFDSMLSHHQWIEIEMDIPEEWECCQRQTSVPIYDNCDHSVFAVKKINFVPRGLKKGRYDVPVVIGSNSRYDKIYTKIVFLVEG